VTRELFIEPGDRQPGGGAVLTTSGDGGRLVKHARYYWPLLAESHLTQRLFRAMVRKDCRLAGQDRIDGAVGTRNHGGKEAREKGACMELAETMGLFCFDVLWQGTNAVGGSGGGSRQKESNSRPVKLFDPVTKMGVEKMAAGVY